MRSLPRGGPAQAPRGRARPWWRPPRQPPAKGPYLAAQLRCLAAPRGVKKALVAVAHTLRGIIYAPLTRGSTYTELGASYSDAGTVTTPAVCCSRSVTATSGRRLSCPGAYRRHPDAIR
jgi:hypothetical protein